MGPYCVFEYLASAAKMIQQIECLGKWNSIHCNSSYGPQSKEPGDKKTKEMLLYLKLKVREVLATISGVNPH
jgi:hypothetical protein